MEIQLSDHFDYKRLIRFVMPSIGMMVFTSIYGVVDGLFVSNFTGAIPFASVNLIMPFLMIFSAVGFMVGTGGTALVSMKLGEGKEREANEIFSLLVYLVIILGILMTIFAEVNLRKVALLFGASEQMLPYCVQYGRIILLSLTFFMLQNMFQSFLVAAERPNIGLYLTIICGVTNMVLDALLVGVLHLGVVGAAAATVTCETTGGLVPLIYFFAPNKSILHLGKTHMNWNAIVKACTNGASEFMTNVSMSSVNILYNWQLLKLAGSNGVAAYGVIMYVTFIFVAVFIGYSIGTAPIVGFNHGAQNYEELQNIFRKSLQIIGVCAVAMVLSARILSGPIAKIFVGYDTDLLAITKNAFRIYSLSYFIMGFNIYGSSFFTGLNNGAVSAAISFLRTLLFQIAMVLLLPALFGINGVWSAVIVAEVLALTVTVTFWVKMRKVYHY